MLWACSLIYWKAVADFWLGQPNPTFKAQIISLADYRSRKQAAKEEK